MLGGNYMAMKLIRKELKIYRGTYAEIMDVETIDMAIYFAWDTREIFVGNSLGVKVPYNGGESLTTNQVKQLINDQLTEEGIASELSLIKNLLTLNNTNYTNINAIAQEALDTVNTFNSTLVDNVNTAVNEVLATWEDSTLGDLYYNKIETTGLIDTAVGTLRNNIYTKLEIDAMNLTDTASNKEFQQYKSDVLKYFAIEVIEAEQSDNIGSLPLSNGLYKITFSTVGNSFVIVEDDNITRITATGKVEVYDSVTDTWPVYADTNDVFSVNGITPVANDITLTTDNIDGTILRPWNNIIPQDGDTYTGAINPLGRHTQYDVGDYSVALGYNVRASGDSSIAVGSQSEASAAGSIQLGQGNNIIDNSFNVWDYQLLRSDGKIPQDRLIERFYEYQFTILPDDWTDKEYIATIEGMTPSALVWVSPEVSSFDNYGKFGIRAVSQGTDFLEFLALDNATIPIKINVIWRN
jgi:hypothetical protein